MKTDLNWELLEDKTQTKHSRYLFDDVAHLMRKVAFDQYKTIATPETLWELREEDGNKFLYAVYDEPTDLMSTSSVESEWTATSDRDGKNVSLSFKNMPLIRFASVEHGFEPNEAEDFAKFLQQRVQDKEFVAKLAQTLPDAKQAVLADLLNGSRT